MNENTMLNSHRVNITFDGVVIFGASVAIKRPENSEEMSSLLRDITAALESPKLEDERLL
jgi:2'-5' RNA ligase